MGIMVSYTAFSQAPATKKEPVKDNVHGFIIQDDYRWLENKDNPEVKSWSKAQHQYTIDFIKKNMPEIAGLRNELTNYLDRDYKGTPFFVGNREFFYARKKGEQQNKLYTTIKGKDFLVFDPLTVDESGKTAISSADFTRDGNKVAIGTQTKGDEILTVRILDSKTGKQIGESIEGLNDFTWAFDEEYCYISLRTKEMIKNQKPVEHYLHKISDGNNRSKDQFMIAPKDAKDVAGVWDTDESGITFFTEGDFYSNTLSFRKQKSNDKPQVIYSSKEFRVSPEIRHNKLWIMTNDNAPNWKIMTSTLDKMGFENWTDFYPEQETVLEAYAITSDFIIIQDKKDVISRLRAFDLNGKFVKDIELPEIGDVSGISYHKESNTVFIGLATFSNPSKTYKLDGKTLKLEFFYQDTPPIDTKEIESKMVFYYSKDSTKVPMFIVYKKGMKLDGNNPTILYGYGGFNISMSPSFIGTTASFINRGGVYAIACLRGGAEYGESWHRDGMLFKKQNTFDDFIAAAEYLIKEKYTSKEKLAVKGGSNGGLLIGAITTQRPDLFKAGICAVPLLDMVRYHKFLIARYWIPEYGDPDKEEDLVNIIKYSPYHNIKLGQTYPSLMVKAGENDTRVDPLHAKKFAAVLQNQPGQTNPILLFVDFESGHGSGQSIEQMVDNMELEWRYLMRMLGIK